MVEMSFPTCFRTRSREGYVAIKTNSTPVVPGVDSLVDGIFLRGFQVKNSKQGRGSFFVADSVQNERSFSVMFFSKPETRSDFVDESKPEQEKIGFSGDKQRTKQTLQHKNR
jgi:hypothetical protein